MSEPIPESIPTSQDPRSRRPTKKRALTPISAQASQVEALFSHPEREINIPISATKDALTKRLPPPPEIVANVQGSSAGAGSGEFHVYKASRRREYERLRIMEEEMKREKAGEEFEKKQAELKLKDEMKTNKNKLKREKAKMRKMKLKEGKMDVDVDALVDGDKPEAGTMENAERKVGGGKTTKTKTAETAAGQKNGDGKDVPQRSGDTPAVVEEMGVIIHDDG
ncbi:MAG: hypothetical protein M1823_004711 [Watsoniomyces obsoletus]|nr:MAG: hypothetical protein M1823_004711 [Watsoniomyces obsoletus]